MEIYACAAFIFSLLLGYGWVKRFLWTYDLFGSRMGGRNDEWKNEI